MIFQVCPLCITPTHPTNPTHPNPTQPTHLKGIMTDGAASQMVMKKMDLPSTHPHPETSKHINVKNIN